ncbi:MAG: DUF1003 domain-containing protein [Alphaproteobacteria bacterium]|nr:DUF1003 domain-containing protein [Alphaproteobacteria bacterium]MDE2110948.1 DUF1003 domain-containing protein [Alphaproteobacteria bacterium]MDE2495897.1 DUF1003 domain-containing protein [Alphaproteobacteria bacterium]
MPKRSEAPRKTSNTANRKARKRLTSTRRIEKNRQEARDRLRAENDYQVNLKAEIEIRALSEKIDQLLHNQWARLLEIQQLQTEMLEDLAEKRKS